MARLNQLTGFLHRSGRDLQPPEVLSKIMQESRSLPNTASAQSSTRTLYGRIASLSTHSSSKIHLYTKCVSFNHILVTLFNLFTIRTLLDGWECFAVACCKKSSVSHGSVTALTHQQLFIRRPSTITSPFLRLPLRQQLYVLIFL